MRSGCAPDTRPVGMNALMPNGKSGSVAPVPSPVPYLHHFIFFDVAPDIADMSEDARAGAERELMRLCATARDVIVYTYATRGLKAQTAYMFWLQGREIASMQGFLRAVLRSALGRHLVVAYTLFGMRSSSIYVAQPTIQEQGIDAATRLPYLIIYPFTKTKEWYFLSYETRKALMMEHIRIGRRYPEIRQLLLYAYGIDDHEFIVAYETDDLQAFQRLVMDLRSTEVRRYTERDTPVFVCVYQTLEDACHAF